MIKQFILFLFIALAVPATLAGQPSDDPVLFSVQKNPVHVSEFLYIYSKTNRNKADFSKASLEEYLDLYTKFKLKVQRAKDMRLDTIQALQKELAGYRKQLADSYLIDKEVTEKLIKEAYERSLKDINISHIMIALKKNPSPKDTLFAYQRVIAIKEKLDGGMSFEEAAKTLSDDKSAQTNNGNIGYFTSPLPNGFYDFESAAYNLEVGKYSNPIKTPLGYHIVKRSAERPARGEIEAAHILIRHKDPNAATKIDSLYRLLQAGSDFEELAKQNSSDKLTAAKGGYVGFFGISKYEKAFEDAAFALERDGEFSKPVKTLAGWHIIKRISHKPIPEYDKAKARLKARIQKDSRFELAKTTMVNRIKTDNGFKSVSGPLNKFAATLDKEFLTYRWEAPKEKSDEILFVLGKEKHTLGQFTDYLEKESRKRMQMSRSGTVVDVLNQLYNDYVDEVALKYEERNLEAKYPDFKALMREYEEGILLFEITKNEVWDKASQDTIGLANFYNKNKDRYKWGKRAVVSNYTLKDAAHLVDKVEKFAKNNPPKAVLAKFNTTDKKPLLHQELVVEKGRNKRVDALEWKAGTFSEMEMDRKNKTITFMKVEEILNSTTKKLSEARGYVVADYQDFLEKQWLAELRKAYKVRVDKKVFKSLIKK